MNQPNEENVRSFEEISQDVAKQFLHTVVLVDDKAFPKPKEPKVVVEEISEPGAEFGDSNETGRSVDAPTNVPQSIPGPDAEQLDARSLMAIFAKEGLICAVIEPLKAADAPATLEQAGKAAKRADVVVLDWDIHKDEGKSTRQIISDIFRGDNENPDRLRLILIYTGAYKVDSILQDVAHDLQQAHHELRHEEQCLVAVNGTWRIRLVRKQDSGFRHVAGVKVEEASVEQLPSLICREFARMTQGLVRNVALASLATLRDNTHTLLGHLTKELDPAYVAHRMLLSTPDDADHHAVELIISELGAMLHSFEVGTTAAGVDALKAWLRAKKSYQIHLGKKDKKNDEKTFDVDTMIQWVVAGALPVSKSTWDDFLKSGGHERLTKMFVEGDEQKARNADNEMAIAMSLTRRYAGDRQGMKRPRLTLGTIVKRIATSDGESEYLLCLQPRCDCVRIDPSKAKDQNGRYFIFVSCVKANENERPFHIVVSGRDNDKVVNQQLKIDMSKPVILRFHPEPDDGGVIRTLPNEGVDVFKDLDLRKYQWIGQLKEAQAQRFANEFAMKLGRVGLNDHEWLRRAAPAKD